MAVLCVNCSGKLIFNPASQKLECAACGSKFSPEDVKDISAEIHSRYYDTRVYTCGHCGAEVITSDTEASTFCVYCGNPAIVFSRISKEYKPDGLIPFKITKEQAINNINLKFKKNPFIPKEIKKKLTADNVRGIYVPYWLINADFTEADFISGEIHDEKRDDKKYFSRAGNTRFENVPVDGSNILNDDVSSKLEPFNFKDAVEFDEDYLNGFYSNTSDLSYNDLRESAANKCHKLFSRETMKLVGVKNIKLEDSIYWINIHDDPLYMMMPVWFFTFKYMDKPHTILVNGQSGKVVGTMPWQQKQIYTIGGTVFALVFLLLCLLFLAIMFDFAGINSIYNHLISGIMFLSVAGFVYGGIGIRKIRKNLEITQAEDIFKFVKKRQV